MNCSPLHQADEADGGAPLAFLALPAVGVEGAVEVAGGAVDVDVERIEAGPAGGQRVRHDLAGGVEHPDRLGAAQGVRGPGVVQPRRQRASSA